MFSSFYSHFLTYVILMIIRYIQLQILSCIIILYKLIIFLFLLWQPLITETNDYTNGKSLSQILSGEFTRELDKESLLNQSPIYTKSSWSMLLIINPALMSMLLPHVCLKATMLYTCALISSSRSFYHILGLMMSRHVTEMSRASSSSKIKRKRKQNPYKVRK